MKILTINTAGSTTEIAFCDGENARYYKDEDGKKASEVLLNEIDVILGETTLSELDYLGVIVGPGSFTGIRIGVNTVKAFCYALNKPAVAITFNKALASRVPNKPVFSVVSGWADYCYVSAYNAKGEEILPPTAMTLEEARLLKGSNYSEYIIVADKQSAGIFPDESVVIVENPKYLISATKQAITSGLATDAMAIEPYYAMKSQAERDLEK